MPGEYMNVTSSTASMLNLGGLGELAGIAIVLIFLSIGILLISDLERYKKLKKLLEHLGTGIIDLILGGITLTGCWVIYQALKFSNDNIHLTLIETIEWIGLIFVVGYVGGFMRRMINRVELNEKTIQAENKPTEASK